LHVHNRKKYNSNYLTVIFGFIKFSTISNASKESCNFKNKLEFLRQMMDQSETRRHFQSCIN
jgi:hypothetical protein